MSRVSLSGNALGTGTFTIASPNSNTDRTLTLPEASGTLNTSGAPNEVPAGSAAAPAIYPTGDTNTGIFFPAADTIAFAEGGAEAMRIDSSGNLNLATSGSALQWSNASNNCYIAASSGNLQFATGTAGFVERARIDSSGNLLVGTTTNSGGVTTGGVNTPNGYGINRNLTDQAGRRNWATATESSNVGDFVFLCSTTNTGNPNTVRFQIRSDGSCFNSTGTYGTLSDIKIKENVTDATPKLNSLLQVRVVNYNRIGEDRKELGVIAQELEQIFPGMVDEQEDLVDGQPSGTTTKAVKYSVFVPMLIKAIQELKADLDATKAELAELKGQA